MFLYVVLHVPTSAPHKLFEHSLGRRHLVDHWRSLALPLAGSVIVRPRRCAWPLLRFEAFRMTRYDMTLVLVESLRNGP